MSSARDLLLARSGTGGELAELAVWAYWKVGGEPGLAVAALGEVATGARIPLPALRMLADLGPRAARYAKRLRPLTTDKDSWTVSRRRTRCGPSRVRPTPQPR